MDQKTDTSAVPFLPVPMAEPKATLERRDNGELVVHCDYPIGDFGPSIVAFLHRWAAETPNNMWLAERGHDGDWIKMNYGDALTRVNAISQYLLDRDFTADTPVMVLSGNSIEHALLSFGAMQIGVPYSAIAQPYSTMGGGFKKLHHVVNLIKPRLIMVQEWAPYAEALSQLDLDGIEVVCVEDIPAGADATSFAYLLDTSPTAAVMAAYDTTNLETVGKYLFTSGSTGMPKAVPQTQRMMCANMKGNEILFPPDPENKPIYLDWLPWNHCYGGNSNFNAVLRDGGEFWIDDGRPLPGQFDATLRNLREVRPTRYLGVATSHGMMVTALEKDPELRKIFFSRLTHLGYGGASLPQEVWERYQTLAAQETGHRIMFYTGYGSTETGPVAATLYWPYEGTGNIGLPMPGTTMKLVPNGSKMEVRMKGDSIFPGYFQMSEKTAESFDEEGFYKIGDALTVIDDTDITQGMMFNGRVVEDFKLLSGTFVNVGNLRNTVNNACDPAIFDCVITGHDKDHIGLLVWPNVEGCQKLAGANLPVEELVQNDAVISHITACLRQHNAETGGSSMRISRIHLMTEAPSVEGGEITEKGYVNQRATLERRDVLVKKLYEEVPGDDVIIIA
jgi:feruloyl-CoA synthase